MVGYASLFIIGTIPACLRVMPSVHEYYDGQWVYDCEYAQGSDEWCVLSHASFNGGACPDGDCSPVPVESASWGGIKAMYR